MTILETINVSMDDEPLMKTYFLGMDSQLWEFVILLVLAYLVWRHFTRHK